MKEGVRILSVCRMNFGKRKNPGKTSTLSIADTLWRYQVSNHCRSKYCPGQLNYRNDKRPSTSDEFEPPYFGSRGKQVMLI